MEAMIRLAGAPISWGVCEVPGWGRMLPAERVLTEMTSLGLTATEFGPIGYLPDADDELSAMLARHQLSVTGGFVPLVLHDAAQADDTLASARATAAQFQRRGAELFVTAAVVDAEWSAPIALSEGQWQHVAVMLDRLDALVAEYGLTQVLHPHWGTLVESAADVRSVLDRSAVRWCLDTGHLALGGVDPVEFTREAGDRVGLVHLKDVDLALAARLRAGELTLMGAVQLGLFRPLGEGDIDVAAVIELLERGGYQGWYVLEQDRSITGDEPAAGLGPIDDVRKSVEYLRARFGVHASA